MLKMAHWIPDKISLCPINEIPNERFIRSGAIRDHRRFIELQNRLSRFSLQPECLREFETSLVKSFPALATVLTGMLRPKVEGGRGEVGILHEEDLRFPDAPWPVTITSLHYG